MRSIKIRGKSTLEGKFSVPGDKSISHRTVMLGAIANGITQAHGFSTGEDCMNTVRALQSLGVDIELKNKLVVCGKGLHGLGKPEKTIDAGNSGTTMRILLGILAGQPFKSHITGDESLRQRPMNRITQPLMKMGAKISGRQGADLAPLVVQGGILHAINHTSSVPSAQVKSAILLAGLYTNGETFVSEPLLSRDHTERMLKFFGADLDIDGLTVGIKGEQELQGKEFTIPGDISSAAFFITFAAICPGSKITAVNVGINPTRTGFISILRRAGAIITVSRLPKEHFEPVAEITVEGSEPKPIEIGPDDMPGLLDEIPILAVAGAVTRGESIIRGAKELRIKETDRLKALFTNLNCFGIDVKETEDGIVIRGSGQLKGCEVDSFGDHRMAMAMTMAGLMAEGETTIFNTDCIDTSFPEFVDIIKQLAPSARLEVISN